MRPPKIEFKLWGKRLVAITDMDGTVVRLYIRMNHDTLWPIDTRKFDRELWDTIETAIDDTING